MRTMSLFLPASFTVLLVAVAGSTLSADEIDFNRDVRPILSSTCYACHGPDPEQREGGDPDQGGLHFDSREGAFADLGGYFAIVAGEPDDSELIRRVESGDPDEVMPPADHRVQLTDTQKQILRDWIQQGAEWQDHWAYVAPVRHETPTTKNTRWPKNLIDNFVLARLEKEGLQPAAEADKRTLLRRLSFDLTGLPPSDADMQAFLADESAEAYEKAVDRLLNSTHYGERLAMYWLDLVRYADTVGYHGDQSVSISPYRDYVIDAFNSNMPFDRFTREQLAGDLLKQATDDQKIASGYNRLGMMSAEGGVQPKEYLAKYMSDRVRTASVVWMGSTLGCAECHNHKYDPFTTEDFYSFGAFFADIKERGLYSGAHASGAWGPRIDVPNEGLPDLLRPLDKQLAELQSVMDTPTEALASAQQEWEIKLAETPQWQVLQPLSATALHGTVLTVQDDHSVLASGNSANTNTYTLTFKAPAEKVSAFRIEVLPHKSLPKNGPGRAGNGNFVITEFRVLRRSSPESDPLPIELRNATATVEQTLAGEKAPDKKWSAASAIDGDAKGATWGWAVLPHVGKPQHLVVETAEDVVCGEGTTLTVIVEQNHEGAKHTVGRFRLSATSSRPVKAENRQAMPEELQKILAVSAANRTPDQSMALAAHYRTIAPALAKTRQQIEALKKKRDQVVNANTRTTLVTEAVDPRPVRVLPRGNWMDDSGKVVEPRVPHFLRQIRTEGRANRLDLANWIVSNDNPLTSRVFVSRLWKLYFGRGLVKVLDDVGTQGGLPVHSELLDRLAIEFVENGWNVKQIIKLMVMSSSYRQSSLADPDLLEVDPYNWLIARQSRFRLDAETIRDNALAVSGLLVDQVGGRSVKPYQPPGLYRHLNFPRRTYQHDTGENQYRRGVYTHWQRQFLHPAMKAFDAPPREECTAERPRSNTPLAALVLLNDPSYVEAARTFAQRIIREGGEDAPSRLQWAVRRALSRDPTEDEVKVLSTLLAGHLEQYRAETQAAQELIAVGLSKAPTDIDAAELAAWTSVARTIFNMHEFITRN